jgi:VanZ family protein
VAKDLHFGAAYLSLVWIVAVALVATGAVLALGRRKGADERAVVGRVQAIWLSAALAAVAALTLQPGPGGFDAPLPSILNPISPLRVPDAVANVVLYLPVGFFAASVWRSKPHPMVWATGLAFALSLLIEFAQLVVPISRSAESHDVVFNTIGGLIGALAACWALRRSGTSERHSSRSLNRR